jgi:cytochrome c oxidase subunit 3
MSPAAGELEKKFIGKFGVIVACASITMMFGAITSAAIFRSGDSDWTRVPLPPILWFNTLVLLVSSYAIQRLDRVWSILLGCLFLAGQSYAWLSLRSAGISEAFFYVFTVTHALHVIGGLFAMCFVRIESARVYWHFLSGLWIYLMILFWIWR